MKKPYVVLGLLALAVLVYLFFPRERVNEAPVTENSSEVRDTEESDIENLASLRVGETKLVSGVSITLNKIVEDSRCPTDAMCIWAGRLVANVTLKSDTDTETLDISSEKAHIFGTFKISLESAAPKPRSTETMSSRNYVVTFRVEK